MTEILVVANVMLVPKKTSARNMMVHARRDVKNVFTGLVGVKHE